MDGRGKRHMQTFRWIIKRSHGSWVTSDPRPSAVSACQKGLPRAHTSVETRKRISNSLTLQRKKASLMINGLCVNENQLENISSHSRQCLEQRRGSLVERRTWEPGLSKQILTWTGPRSFYAFRLINSVSSVIEMDARLRRVNKEIAGEFAGFSQWALS